MTNSSSSAPVMRRRSARQQQSAAMGRRARGGGGGHREEMKEEEKEEDFTTDSIGESKKKKKQRKTEDAVPLFSSPGCTCQHDSHSDASSMVRTQGRHARGSDIGPSRTTRSRGEGTNKQYTRDSSIDKQAGAEDVTAIADDARASSSSPSSSKRRQTSPPVGSTIRSSSGNGNHAASAPFSHRTYSLPVLQGHPISYPKSASRPPSPAKFLASASSSAWSIAVNDDAPLGDLAFNFPLDNGSRSRQSGSVPPQKSSDILLSPPDNALALAPFLFDNTNGDEPHPLVPAIRKRASSLPAVLAPPTASPVALDELQDWLVGTATESQPRQASSASSTSTSSLSGPSRSNTDSSDSASSSTTTAATSVSSNSLSDPSSPTSSQEESLSKANKSQTHSTRSSPYASKRSLDGYALDTPERLKKHKLSHKIRSFLLLRPPGFPLPGTDGAADIQHILRAPPWLKNATSELGKESRMAPHEWKWADTSSHIQNWSITSLERKFQKLLKSNMDREDLENAERQSLSRLSPVPDTPPNGNDLTSNLDDPKLLRRPPSSPILARAARKRLRQLSAPPNMEADPEKVINDKIAPPHHGTTSGTQEGSGGSSYSQVYSSPPPEVLKSQLLAVLRSRLPEGAKTGDAPLRMKKFVVWNAWVRRASVSNSRSRFRPRSASPEASAAISPGSSRIASSLLPSSTHSRLNHPDTEQIVIDLEPDINDASENQTSKSGLTLASPPSTVQQGSPLPIDSNDSKMTHFRYTDNSLADSPFTATSLGLMMHDETARTARRFSRAFDEDEEENQADQALQNDFTGNEIDGPFMNARSKSYENHGVEHHPMSDETVLHLHSPSPLHSNQYHQRALANFQYPAESHRYSSSDEYALSDLEENHSPEQQNRPMSPLRSRLEYKVSTATPPSYSADLAGDNHVSSPHHHSHHQRDRYGDLEEATIVPFWFDQDSVTFDTEEQNANSQNQSSDLTEEAPSPSLSPNNRKQMANATASKGGRRSGDWEALTREGIPT